MKPCSRSIALAVLLGSVGMAAAQETLPPAIVGGGQTTTVHMNGQVVECSATNALVAIIYFVEVSSHRVAGTAVRASGGSSSGDVTIRWINRALAVTLHLSPIFPDRLFGLDPVSVKQGTLSEIKGIYRAKRTDH